ncbi:MAG: NAD-dependent epimerase/dehydratase family protein, partial [Pseudonocardia sp.]|nr:NAD-dependent epimerase/dehydratase family protein [Pseudonocardia sp.]
MVIVRPAETFGPGQAAGKLLPYAAACALRGEAPRLSSGRRRGDWVFVDDVVDGMLSATRRAPTVRSWIWGPGCEGPTARSSTGCCVRSAATS